MEGLSEQSPTHVDSRPAPPQISDPPVNFVTARAAENLLRPGSAVAAPFNPHLDSPSIRKTQGVDHSKTKPIPRDALVAPSPASLPQPAPRIMPRVGAPSVSSPLQNRGQYRPPSVVKRPASNELIRPPLSEVTTNSINTQVAAPTTAKKTKTENETPKLPTSQ